MSNRRTCLTGVHVLQDGISYRIFDLREDTSYWCVCIIGSHAFLKGMSYRWTCLTEVLVL